MSDYVSSQETTQLIEVELKKNEESDLKARIKEAEENGRKIINFLNNVVYDIETFGFLIKPGTDVQSSDQHIQQFVDYIFDKIPDNLSKVFPDKETLFEHCIDENSENNMFKFVMCALTAVLNKIAADDPEKIEMYLLSVWGISGHGKSTLIKILATVFNSINPGDEDIANIKIDANKVGTEKISDIIKFNVGAYKMGVIDVPGTEDISAERTNEKILEQLKDMKVKLNNILNVIDISKEDRNVMGDRNTLNALAAAYKDQGLEFWDKVIVCFTQTNKLSFLEAHKPVWHNDFSEEEMNTYITNYIKYIEDHTEEVAGRVKAAKEHYKENWKALFTGSNGNDPILDDTSEEEKERVFKKIKFVVCGSVIPHPLHAKTNNPFKKGTVMSIPFFEVIPLDPCFSEATQKRVEEINKKITNGDYVLYKNWANDIFNKVIESSSLKFQINCANLNTKAISKREIANNEHQKKAQQERRPEKNVDDLNIQNETKKKIAGNLEEPLKIAKEKNQKSNYQDGVTAIGGAVLGGAGTFAAAAAGWWIAAGLAIGAGGGWVFSKGVSWVSGGNWF